MSQRVDFKTIKRPSSPNTYLLAPKGYCDDARPGSESPLFNLAPAALYDRVKSILTNKAAWSVTVDEPDSLHLEAIVVTKVLKFKDDVAIEIVPDDAKPQNARIAIYSRSRVGYSDLGANRKRVHNLVEELKHRTATSA